MNAVCIFILKILRVGDISNWAQTTANIAWGGEMHLHSSQTKLNMKLPDMTYTEYGQGVLYINNWARIIVVLT